MPGRIQPGTENSHLQQGTFTLWFRTERSSAVLTQSYLTCTRDQHPTDTAPVLTKSPAVGQEMEVTRCWCHAATPVPSSSSHAGNTEPCFGFWSLCNLGSLQGVPCPVCSCWQLRQGHSRVPSEGGSWWPAACLGNACSQLHAQSPVLLASPTAVPLQESVLLILSFLPRAQQHSLLPASQGKALEAPGAPTRNPSL